MPPDRTDPEPERGAFLRALLQRDNLKWNWEAIAADCAADPALIGPLLGFCTDPETAVQQNAGAVLGKIVDLDPDLLVPHLRPMLDNLRSLPHDAVKRATMRSLQRVAIPADLEGEVFDLAVRLLADPGEAIAIRAFSITTARRLCERYPPLRQELLPLVREIIDSKPSPGTLSRAKRELEALEALEDEGLPH